jgi:hypothetical protein
MFRKPVLTCATLVALERDEVVAGAHLKRYQADPAVSLAGEVVWFRLPARQSSSWTCLACRMPGPNRRLGARDRWASGSLPATAPTHAWSAVPDCRCTTGTTVAALPHTTSLPGSERAVRRLGVVRAGSAHR